MLGSRTLTLVTTRLPFAAWRPTAVNFTRGGVVRPPNGLVLHIAQGSFAGTEQWERNPNAKVSSYAVVGKLGQCVQEVDLDDKAWTESAGNEHWIGVEFEGFAGESLTPAQITVAAQILAFLHTHYGVPLQATDDVSGHGLGWHGMGGNAWGGHPGCPGTPIVAQRPQIIAAAARLVHAPTSPAKDTVMPQYVPSVVVEPVVASLADPQGGAWTLAASGAIDAWGGARAVRGANGASYFVGRKAARLALPNAKEAEAGKVVVIIDSTDHRYALPA